MTLEELFRSFTQYEEVNKVLSLQKVDSKSFKLLRLAGLCPL